MAFKFDFGSNDAAASGGDGGFKFNFGGEEDEVAQSQDTKSFDFDEYRSTPDSMVKARSPDLYCVSCHHLLLSFFLFANAGAGRAGRAIWEKT